MLRKLRKRLRDCASETFRRKEWRKAKINKNWEHALIELWSNNKSWERRKIKKLKKLRDCEKKSGQNGACENVEAGSRRPFKRDEARHSQNFEKFRPRTASIRRQSGICQSHECSQVRASLCQAIHWSFGWSWRLSFMHGLTSSQIIKVTKIKFYQKVSVILSHLEKSKWLDIFEWSKNRIASRNQLLRSFFPFRGQLRRSVFLR